MIIIEMLSIIMIMIISCSSVPFAYLFVSSVRCFDDRSPRRVSPQRPERRRRRKGMRARRNRPHRPRRVCPPLIRITRYFLIHLIRHWIRNALTSRSSSFHDGFCFERKISQKRLVYFPQSSESLLILNIPAPQGTLFVYSAGLTSLRPPPPVARLRTRRETNRFPICVWFCSFLLSTGFSESLPSIRRTRSWGTSEEEAQEKRRPGSAAHSVNRRRSHHRGGMRSRGPLGHRQQSAADERQSK